MSVVGARPSRFILLTSSSATNPKKLLFLACLSIFRCTDGSTPSSRIFFAASRWTPGGARECDRWIHAESQRFFLLTVDPVAHPPQLCAVWLNEQMESAPVRKLDSFLPGFALRNRRIGERHLLFLCAGLGARALETRPTERPANCLAARDYGRTTVSSNLEVPYCFCWSFGRPRTSANVRWCRGGVEQFSLFNALACPTIAKRPIQSQ